jgi:hypothetical protein
MRELEVYTYTCLVLEAMALDPAAAAFAERVTLWECFDNRVLANCARIIVIAWESGASQDEIAKLLPRHIRKAVMRDRVGVGALSGADMLDVVRRCAKRLHELYKEKKLRELEHELTHRIKS